MILYGELFSFVLYQFFDFGRFAKSPSKFVIAMHVYHKQWGQRLFLGLSQFFYQEKIGRMLLACIVTPILLLYSGVCAGTHAYSTRGRAVCPVPWTRIMHTVPCQKKNHNFDFGVQKLSDEMTCRNATVVAVKPFIAYTIKEQHSAPTQSSYVSTIMYTRYSHTTQW